MTTEATWGVWCSVSGGVTGHRESWMKDGDKYWRGTEAEARAYVTKLYDDKKGYHGPAMFSYYAQPMATFDLVKKV